MKRFTAMHLIVNFGRNEERELLLDGKKDAAYQIECARNTLIYFLNENPVKNVHGRLEAMTAYTIDPNGYWHYDAPCFVMDELTRSLLLDLKEQFAQKG